MPDLELAVAVPPERCHQVGCTEIAIFIAVDEPCDRRIYACRSHLGGLLTADVVWQVAAIRLIDQQIHAAGWPAWKSKRLAGAAPSDG